MLGGLLVYLIGLVELVGHVCFRWHGQLGFRRTGVGLVGLYRSKYRDQNETTAKTWILRNLVEGRPRTWSK